VIHYHAEIVLEQMDASRLPWSYALVD
jgi:hypothetical protein